MFYKFRIYVNCFKLWWSHALLYRVLLWKGCPLVQVYTSLSVIGIYSKKSMALIKTDLSQKSQLRQTHPEMCLLKLYLPMLFQNNLVMLYF